MCTSPITIKIQGNGRFAGLHKAVPCGHCFECQSKFQNDWAYRISKECELHKNAYFFTLTYNENSVPLFVNEETGELVRGVCKKHIQDWIKRGRSAYHRDRGSTLRFKYFITSEYGPNTCRPHYHGIFMSDEDLRTFCNFFFYPWSKQMGFVSFKKLQYGFKGTSGFEAPASYIAKYCAKPDFATHENERMGNVPPTFRLISKGIASEFRNEFRDKVYGFHFRRLQDYIQSDKKLYSLLYDYHKDGSYCKNLFSHLDDQGKVLLGQLYDSLVYHKNTSHGIFTYKLPRYISDHARYETHIVEKPYFHPKKLVWTIRKVKEYIRDNELSFAFDDLLLQRERDFFNQKFREIQAVHPAWSDIQVLSELCHNEARDLENRAKSKYESMYRWYIQKKSKFPKL